MTTSGPAALDLVQHAESGGNVADRRANHVGAEALDLHVRDSDVELSPVGLRQARALGAWLARRPAELRPEIVLSSPYRQAVATGGPPSTAPAWTCRSSSTSGCASGNSASSTA
jgi:phosphohistidine phosphatase SixA